MSVYPIGNYPVPPWNRTTQRGQRLKSFRAKEFKYQTERIPLDEITQLANLKTGVKDISDKTNSSDNEPDKKKWVDKLFAEKSLYGKTICDIQLFGFNQLEAKEIVDESIRQTERATNWATNNEYYANIAAKSALVSAIASVVNSCLKHLDENDETVPVIFKRSLNVIENISAASRGYIQYEKIYGGRNDDDRARNNYEAEVYGNKVAGIFGNLAYIFETNINPVALGILGFTEDKTKETIQPLLSLFNPLWWKIRMLAEIDQQFGTDLLTYLINKPLVLCKIESAIKKVKKIKDSGYFNYRYVQSRLIEQLGLDPEKHKLKEVFPELARLMKTLFNNDTEKSIHNSEHIGKFLAPILGFYGFVAYGISVPIKSILHWLNKESKWINLIAKSGSASQQILYLFRMFLPEYFDNKRKKYSESEPEKFKLKQERTRLFHTGAAVCSLNVLSTVLQLFNTENSNGVIKTAKEIVETTAEKGINYYFSERRRLLGKKFRLDNPELYNINGTPKIISDKVCVEEKPQAVTV